MDCRRMPPALRAWHNSPQIHVFLEKLHQDVPTRVNLIGTSTRASLFLVPLQAHEPGPQRPHRHPSFGTHSQVGKSLPSMHFVICPGWHFGFSGSPAIIGALAFACLVQCQREPRFFGAPRLRIASSCLPGRPSCAWWPGLGPLLVEALRIVALTSWSGTSTPWKLAGPSAVASRPADVTVLSSGRASWPTSALSALTS